MGFPSVSRRRRPRPTCRRAQLDERLSRHAEAPRFAVERFHHPGREIDVHPLRGCADPPRPAQIELICDFLTCIEFPIKCLRFHKSQKTLYSLVK